MPGLTAHDHNLAQSLIFAFQIGNNAKGPDATNFEYLEFQFPPKITSDGRKGTWKEGELPGTEPVAAFATSSAREIALSAVYIIGTDGWSVEDVHAQIRMARGYFARVRSRDNVRAQLICKMKLWHIGGPDFMTCRLVNVGVKYSDTIVGSGKNAFPLRTDLTLDIRLWTEGSVAPDGYSRPKDAVVEIPGLKSAEEPLWY